MGMSPNCRHACLLLPVLRAFILFACLKSCMFGEYDGRKTLISTFFLFPPPFMFPLFIGGITSKVAVKHYPGRVFVYLGFGKRGVDMHSCRSATVVMIILTASLSLVGCGLGRRTALIDEPEVTVVVNTETGETRTMPIEEYIKGVVAGEMGRSPHRRGPRARLARKRLCGSSHLGALFHHGIPVATP